MLLGRALLKEMITRGTLEVRRHGDLVEAKDLVIGTNSIDVTLSDKFILTGPSELGFAVDPYNPRSMQCEEITADSYILDPGATILGCTQERFIIHGGPPIAGLPCAPMIAPMYDGRSTCGRLFLASHITAGYGDVGFQSAWTLELKNMAEHALVLHAGMRIGQVSFQLVLGVGDETYHGAYENQHEGPKAPVLGKERF